MSRGENKVKIYAKALAEALDKKGADEKKISANFVKLLVKSGDEKKAKQILDLAQDLLLKKQGKKKIIIESARELNNHNKNLLEKIAKDGDVLKEKINQDLIAGVKITINNEKQFDASLKNKLQNIF